jgi:penicillin-binding protein 2
MEPGGTAQVLSVPGMDVAGKTGSAQMIFNGHHRLNSVFVCFAPADHPKIAIAVLVEGAGFGMEVAGPIARRMLSEYLHLNLPPVEMHVGRIHGGD